MLWAMAACLTPAARPLRSLPCSGCLVLKHASLLRVGSSRAAAMMTHAGSVGKGFGGGEATRDPAPTAYDANDPKSKQQAVHKAESFAQYIASRAAAAATTEAQPAVAAAVAADCTAVALGRRAARTRIRIRIRTRTCTRTHTHTHTRIRIRIRIRILPMHDSTQPPC